MEQFNKLTPAEHERLAILLEEMGEVQQIIGKILRHGYESHHPLSTETNRELLQMELGDVIWILSVMNEKDLDPDKVGKWAIEKEKRIKKYLHHQ